jgi:hypothetical protein
MEKLDKLLLEYCDRFGNNFPLFMVRSMPDNEVIETIEKSLKSNKPFKPKINPDYDY